VSNHEFLTGRVVVKVGDITKEQVDSIVNAANWTLLGGGGVDGAIHAKGGKTVYNECKIIRETLYPKGLPTGKAVITTGGNLPAKFVIHTVGPIYRRDARQAELLADCYQNSLALAVEKGLKTIAFPSISTGAFSYPKHEAAEISSLAIKQFLDSDKQIDCVRLIFFDESDAKKFIKHQTF
jgi:O-acetyl-ADP-ribose deacetylase